ncbi:DNA cytosine methyltransferase [Salinibacter ruber]|uniref:DNA cytosine methyltransferase n=1 Tax=Salinibacter ruber TaxID=146919 RepID=UPI002167213F|nr:DNA cytosine methyltransferase [Salinibacter ruber]MCS3645419.1 DNA (cytosine-5)-methyltransferase 1 [Salinibacter ruber]
MSELRYSCIESFCGPGGLSLGLEWAGFETLTAFDHDDESLDTFNQYRDGKVAFKADSRELEPENLRNKADLDSNEELDLLSGGPPCQGFSKQKRGAHLGDERNHRVIDFAVLVGGIQPRFFVLENVATFGKKRGKKFMARIRDLLGEEYDLTDNTYNAADYGLAQTRERFILVGRRKDVDAYFEIPKPTVGEWKTVREQIGDLPEPPEDYSEHPEYPNHEAARVSDKNVERFSHVPPGGGWQDIPYDLRLDCHKDVDTSSGGWPDVYGRLEWDSQAPTLTKGFDSFTRGRYGHPEYDRPITPREAARLQGFPDDYEFVGNKGDVRGQIGNAVPPPLAMAIGLKIRRALMIDDGVLDKKDTMPMSRKGQYELELPETTPAHS